MAKEWILLNMAKDVITLRLLRDEKRSLSWIIWVNTKCHHQDPYERGRWSLETHRKNDVKWRSHKPRNANTTRSWERQGTSLLEAPEELQPCQLLASRPLWQSQKTNMLTYLVLIEWCSHGSWYMEFLIDYSVIILEVLALFLIVTK